MVVECYAVVRRQLGAEWTTKPTTQSPIPKVTPRLQAGEIMSAIEDDMTATGVVSQRVHQQLQDFMDTGGYQAVVELLGAAMAPAEVTPLIRRAGDPISSYSNAAVRLDFGSDISSDEEDVDNLASAIRRRSQARVNTRTGMAGSDSESESDSDTEGRMRFGENVSNNAELLRILRLLRVEYSAASALTPSLIYGQTQWLPFELRCAMISTICNRPIESELRMYPCWQEHVRVCFSFIVKSCSMVPASPGVPAAPEHLAAVVGTIAFLRASFPMAAWTSFARALQLAFDDPLDPGFTVAVCVSTTMLEYACEKP
jgi:hypothetical protein